MADLVTAFPARQLHVVDLPYRLCSWALDEPDSIGCTGRIGHKGPHQFGLYLIRTVGMFGCT